MMSLFSFAQEKYPVYCDICVYENHEGFSKYSKVNFDFGGRRNVDLFEEVTKIVYFIGNEHMLIAHDSNRLRFS